jgi:hypothetical protein
LQGEIQKPGPIDTKSLYAAELAFIKTYRKGPALAYKHFLSQQSILCRNQELPAIKKEDQGRIIKLMPARLQFSWVAGSVSTTLAYTYGTTTLDNKTENYLHIWRKEKDGWKLAVDVVRL